MPTLTQPRTRETQPEGTLRETSYERKDWPVGRAKNKRLDLYVLWLAMAGMLFMLPPSGIQTITTHCCIGFAVWFSHIRQSVPLQ